MGLENPKSAPIIYGGYEFRPVKVGPHRGNHDQERAFAKARSR